MCSKLSISHSIVIPQILIVLPLLLDSTDLSFPPWFLYVNKLLRKGFLNFQKYCKMIFLLLISHQHVVIEDGLYVWQGSLKCVEISSVSCGHGWFLCRFHLCLKWVASPFVDERFYVYLLDQTWSDYIISIILLF